MKHALYIIIVLLLVLNIQASNTDAVNTSSFSHNMQLRAISSTGTLSDYQMRILFINSTEQNNYGFIDTIYVNGETQPDFDDVRFTDSNGNDLYYTKVAYEQDKWALFFVKVPTITTQGTVVNIYYGNDTIGDNSDGQNTFLRWFGCDDCCADVYGDAWDGVHSTAKFKCNSTITSKIEFAGVTEGAWPYSGVNRWRRRYYNINNISGNIAIGLSLKHTSSVYAYQDYSMPFWFGLTDNNNTGSTTTFGEKFLGAQMYCMPNNGSSRYSGAYYDGSTTFTPITKYGALQELWTIETAVYNNILNVTLQNNNTILTGYTYINDSLPLPGFKYFMFGWREKIDGGPTMDRPYHAGLLDSLYVRSYTYPEPEWFYGNFTANFTYNITEQNYINNDDTLSYHIVNFSDTSSALGIKIDEWLWNFGDGHYVGGRYSIYSNVTHVYTINWYNKTQAYINASLTIYNYTYDIESTVYKNFLLEKVNFL